MALVGGFSAHDDALDVTDEKSDIERRVAEREVVAGILDLRSQPVRTDRQAHQIADGPRDGFRIFNEAGINDTFVLGYGDLHGLFLLVLVAVLGPSLDDGPFNRMNFEKFRR